MVEKALDLLRTPRTPEELAQALGLTRAGVELLLGQLWQRGYVQPLSCGGGCRTCSFKAACQGPRDVYWLRVGPSHGPEPQPPTS